jgi:hypothetical protein
LITCLTNYIGISDVSGHDEPVSGDYINDLPGIATNSFNEIAEDEEYSLAQTWVDIEKRSISGIEADINIALKKYFKNYSFVGNTITGFYDDNLGITQSDVLSGWIFDLYPYSKNLSLNINVVELYLTTAANFFIYIYNASTGDKLEEIDVEGVQGINRIPIHKTYPTWKYSRLFVAYDSSVVSTIRATDQVSQGFNYMERGEISNTSSKVYRNHNGAQTGLIVNFNILCSIDQFVCNRIELFKESYLYKLGIEFCQERIYSDRVNRYTLLDREEAIRLRDEFKTAYAEKINGVLHGLKITDNDFCFECNKQFNMRYAIP